MSSVALQRVGMVPELPSQALMRRETRIAYGQVPHCLFGAPLPETNWQMIEDEFLLRGEGDHYFHYRRGQGIMIERGARSDLSEESLWLNGSVYGAIASMNGLLPIHASAIAHDGRVYAFTGPAGAGKSTLVAALGQHGLPMFCDDTLVLDLSDPEQVYCLPGHKRLKLRPDALGLTGASPQERVSQTVDKFYAAPAGGVVEAALPLHRLIFLEAGIDMKISPIEGGERLVRLQDDHQTAQLFASAQRMDRLRQFAHLTRLARQIAMARFVRPIDPGKFEKGIALAASYVTGDGHE